MVCAWRRGVGRLRWRSFGEEWVVFNEHSGSTHLLNALAVDVLRLVEASPIDSQCLVLRLASLYRLEPDEGFHQRIEALLEEFDELGLIEAGHS